MQTQLQLGRYVHVCINETHSLANLQDLIPTLVIPAEVGIKSCRFARECASFMHTWTYLPSWSCVCMISWIASLLLVSLLFIAIPTPF